jgi:predicted nucleotidyltransferase
MVESKLKQLRRIMRQVVKELKQDKNTLVIILKGSCASGMVWEESDVDFVRIVKGESKQVYWKWIEGVRIEIEDISIKEWIKKQEQPSFEELEARLHAIAHDTKILYDPKKIIKKKYPAGYYPIELKLYVILSQLSDARYSIKGARKSLAMNWPIACNLGLRMAVGCFASALFAINEIPREPRFWLDAYEKLKCTPKGFKQIYKNVMLQQSRKETEKYVKRLWQIYKDVLNFCKPDVLKIVQKLGGAEKTKEKLKLITLYSDVLQEFMTKKI